MFDSRLTGKDAMLAAAISRLLSGQGILVVPYHRELNTLYDPSGFPFIYKPLLGDIYEHNG